MCDGALSDSLWLCSKNISVTDKSSVTLSPSEVDLDAADVVSGVYCVYSVTDSSPQSLCWKDVYSPYIVCARCIFSYSRLLGFQNAMNFPYSL